MAVTPEVPLRRLLRPNFNILIGGGALGSDETGHGCNLIPGREMLEATFGRVGQNMSITACAGGHVAWCLRCFFGHIYFGSWSCWIWIGTPLEICIYYIYIYCNYNIIMG